MDRQVVDNVRRASLPDFQLKPKKSNYAGEHYTNFHIPSMQENTQNKNEYLDINDNEGNDDYDDNED